MSHIVRQEIPLQLHHEEIFNLINCTVPFNRAPCIQSGVDLLQNDDTFFICDVDLLVKIDTLQRIRFHVDNGKVYFPVFFSQYKTATSDIAEINGFWRTFSYGMLAMKKVHFPGTFFPRLSLESFAPAHINILECIRTNRQVRFGNKRMGWRRFEIFRNLCQFQGLIWIFY